jgi:hypothetical protein
VVHVDLSTPESVEQMRRSLAMLAPQAWALKREEAIEVLAVLCAALAELRREAREQLGDQV